LGRESGKPINGHVEAVDAEAAYQVLSDRGIITETLKGDPAAPAAKHEHHAGEPDVSLFENSLDEALDSALDASSKRVPFDALTKFYRGKKVRVIDRDKIRQQVAEVVDATLLANELLGGNSSTSRERVAEAIRGLFQDSRNVTRPHHPQPEPPHAEQLTDPGLNEQIGKLSGVVRQAESLISAMQSALRNVEGGGAGHAIARRHLVSTAHAFNAEQDTVLREIFESNLELRRTIATDAIPSTHTN
jgi:hypothetical protein